MSDENRTVTIIPWPEPEDKTATPPELDCPRYSDLNYWQDYGTRMMSLDGVQTPPGVGFEDIEGSLSIYTQVEVADASSIEIGTFVSPRKYATALDLHNRAINCTCWTIGGGVINLPKGANYDPANFLNAPLSHLWFTGTGAADGIPPVGFVWTPWANIYLYAGDVNNTTSLRCTNNTGGTIYLVISASITQVITT